ncbi:MAG TPA: hypothetical protein PL045_10910 [Chitinophagaceae bacterium]|nr:hypothetical protein [Chitinophagaceae bacterium]
MKPLMKYFFLLSISLLLFSCNNQSNTIAALQLKVDSLQKELQHTYKPGLGEFMSSIQVHHEKLWFAGQAGNWRLADFEINEIAEALNNIQQYNADRPEAPKTAMLLPVIDSVKTAIEQKDNLNFTTSFVRLTNTCNNCHREVDYDFNTILIPTTPPFSNQSFKLN